MPNSVSIVDQLLDKNIYLKEIKKKIRNNKSGLSFVYQKLFRLYKLNQELKQFHKQNWYGNSFEFKTSPFVKKNTKYIKKHIKIYHLHVVFACLWTNPFWHWSDIINSFSFVESNMGDTNTPRSHAVLFRNIFFIHTKSKRSASHVYPTEHTHSLRSAPSPTEILSHTNEYEIPTECKCDSSYSMVA